MPDALSVRFPLNRRVIHIPDGRAGRVVAVRVGLLAIDYDDGGRGMYTDAWSAANPTALRLVSWLA